jgi:hypothetical protein
MGRNINTIKKNKEAVLLDARKEVSLEVKSKKT